MLLRVIAMMSIAAVSLALAACAATGGALAANAAQEAAVIAATQVSIATTQAIDQLEAASTQMSTQTQTGIRAGKTPGLPQLPPVRKGTMIIIAPHYMIIQKDGKRLIVPREDYINDNPDQSQ